MLTLAATAWAEPPVDRARARTAFREALRHYNLGEFDEARAGFKDAYRAYDDPSFLFDIGQCERQLGLKQEALNSYRAYLREAREAPNRLEVSRLVTALEAALREEQSSRNLPPPGVLAGNSSEARLPLQTPNIEAEPAPTPPPPTAPPTAPPPTPPPPAQLAPVPLSPAPVSVADNRERHHRRALALGLGIAGGALVVAGVIVLGCELGLPQYPTANMGAVTLR
jgi:tetratricopeptide (TPR) repeat protein